MNVHKKKEVNKLSHDKERDLLYAVLEAQKRVEGIEEEIKKFDPALTKAREVQESAEKQLIEHMEDTGKDTFRSTDFNVSVNLREDFYASFDKENKEKAVDWIEEDCGNQDIVKRDPAVHHKTLSSFLLRRIKEALPIPAGLFKTYYKKVLKIKKV